jgi:hypothetical protein
MTERLTTLSIVKDWLSIEADSSDAALTRLIEAASQFVLNYCNRDSLTAKTRTDNFIGNGRPSQLVKNWPIISVASVGLNGILVNQATLGVGGKPSQGFTIGDPLNGPQSIDLWGYLYPYGLPCQIVYKSGYEASETGVIPHTHNFSPITGGIWTADGGVTLDGVTAVKVSSNPSAGQYAVSEWGIYSFNASDEDGEITVTYSYCPHDLVQAVTQLIGEWWRRKDRIGQLSKTLGGQETVSFTNRDMTDTIRSVLQNHKDEVPVG